MDKSYIDSADKIAQNKLINRQTPLNQRNETEMIVDVFTLVVFTIILFIINFI